MQHGSLSHKSTLYIVLKTQHTVNIDNSICYKRKTFFVHFLLNFNKQHSLRLSLVVSRTNSEYYDEHQTTYYAC